MKLFRNPDLFLESQKNNLQISLGELKEMTEREMVSIGRGSGWKTVDERYPPGTIVTGRVTGLPDFGIFVELEPGIEGLIHASTLRPKDGTQSRAFYANELLKVRVIRSRAAEYKIDLALNET